MAAVRMRHWLLGEFVVVTEREDLAEPHWPELPTYRPTEVDLLTRCVAENLHEELRLIVVAKQVFGSGAFVSEIRNTEPLEEAA